MANISLDGFLSTEEKSLADLDWLDVDPSLPFDDTPEYVAVPKLEQAWTHQEDYNSFNLIQNKEMNFDYKLPMAATASEEADDVQKILNFTKTQMMAGKKGNELRSILEEKSTSHIIKAAFEHLKKLSYEQGLLGYVYIDPTVFSKCDEGAEFVRKRAKTAKYVVAMDKCDGCAFNKAGRCEVYKKHLASEVEYNQELFDFYSKHFSNVTGREVRIASKQDLRLAFTVENKIEVKTAENKPSIKEIEKEEKTLEKKETEYKKSLNDLQDALSKVTGNKIAKEIAWLLVKGYSSDIIKTHVSSKYTKIEIEENKSAIASVLEKQGSLGKVYIDASLLPVNLCNKKEAKDFFDKYARDVHYVLASCSCTSCACKTTSSKKVVKSLSDIPKEIWDTTFHAYSSDITNKLSHIYSNDKSQGLRLAYLQDGISKISLKASGKVESFELTSNVDSIEYKVNSSKEVFFTPSKISAALDKGFTLSKIMKTAKSLGVGEIQIKDNIVKAFESYVTSVNKHQLDVEVTIPQTVKVKMSGKDIAMDLAKPLTEVHVLSYDSSESPIDTLVHDMDLRSSNLDSSITADSKYEEIEISGLDQFTIE